MSTPLGRTVQSHTRSARSGPRRCIPACGHAYSQHDRWSRTCTRCHGCSYFGVARPAPATDADVKELLEGVDAQREGELEAERRTRRGR